MHFILKLQKSLYPAFKTYLFHKSYPRSFTSFSQTAFTDYFVVMYLVSALLTFGTLCLRILFKLLLSTVSKDVLTNIMHISVTVQNTDFYVRRSVYRSTTGLQASKENDDDDDDDYNNCQKISKTVTFADVVLQRR